MTPHDSKNTLDRLWADVPVGAPPIDDLVRGGRAMRRRARLRVAGGAAALTLAVVAGSTVAANTVFDGSDPRPDGEVPAAVDAPTAPAGKRLVGVGRVVVAVPAAWGTNELDGCGSPEEPTVWFPIENTPLDCITPPYDVASVQFTTLDTEAGQAAVKAVKTALGDGLAFRGTFVCPPNAKCWYSPDAAPQAIVVPSQNVAITLFGPARAQDTLDAIADSVQLLPEGYTTVPFVEGNNLAAWKTAIAETGLVPDGALPECEDVVTPQAGVSTNAACEAQSRMRLEPGPGSVVAVGSTVTLFPSVALGTPLDLPTSDWEPGDRAQAAYFTGELAVDQDGCMTLDRAAEGAGVVASRLVWPAGYTASRDADGRTSIFGPDGDLVAMEGDRVAFGGGGGQGQDSSFRHACVPGGDERVLFVQSAVTVME